MRPSLSEQLSSIGAKVTHLPHTYYYIYPINCRPSLPSQAEALTADIRKTHGLQHHQLSPLDSPLCTYPANAFAVGRLECRYPSPVAFFR